MVELVYVKIAKYNKILDFYVRLLHLKTPLNEIIAHIVIIHKIWVKFYYMTS